MPDLFWELVKTERDRAIRIAYQIVFDHEAAKDIAQDAFLKAFKALPRFQGKAKLST
jgi:DNA-directed RNA polymerase specialized sigma24 family protein